MLREVIPTEGDCIEGFVVISAERVKLHPELCETTCGNQRQYRGGKFDLVVPEYVT